ncbi:TRAP transporter small permease subunit [Pelagibacterium limicola]|uniref:TRAP transporter small permease subunit n=1 Tax=Pelagibacterium limicola TaxID=2791022 RepID=UPI0018AFF184|nr:TRAP transporter small permease subunit [Pelagibacterium limicola]
MSEPGQEIELDLEQIESAAARGGTLDFPRTALSDVIEAVLGAIGAVINWIWIVLVLVIVANVIGRYIFSVNFIWVEEVQWHLYAIGFMIGIGYAILHDTHVRVDVIAGSLSPRKRAVIEFLGIALLILPLVYLMITYSIPFVERSFTRGEGSPAVGGLPSRWMIKSVLLIAFAYIGLAALARLVRVSAFLFGFPKAKAQ